MPLDCWLSLLPLTDSNIQETTPTYNQHSSNLLFNSSTRNSRLHRHDHHPQLNSLLKPFIIDSPTASRRFKSSLSCHVLPLQDTSSSVSNHLVSNFETRPLQVCDIDRVRELHSLTLPVSYSCSFFYNLLSSNSNGSIISLVATLPSTGLETSHSHHQSSRHHHCRSTLTTSNSSNHHTHHHITSPLSGRKPISLDVVGCITAKIPNSCASCQEEKDRSIRILTLCVAPDYRRMGIGRMLLKDLIQRVKLDSNNHHHQDDNRAEIKINLHVQATNLAALLFYQNNGFKPTCFQPAYYINNDLKPLDPTLRGTQKNSTVPFYKCESKQPTEKKDIDAWLLELTIKT